MTGMQKIRYCALGAVLLLSVSSVSVLAACGRRSFAAVTSETATHPFAETERETVQTEAAREKKNDERMEETKATEDSRWMMYSTQRKVMSILTCIFRKVMMGIPHMRCT